MHLIKDIKLPDNSYFFIDDDKNKKEKIENLSKINIFVGENNTGKSRLLRKLLSTELNYIPNNFSIENLNKAIQDFRKSINDYYKKRNISVPRIDVVLKNIDVLEYYNDSIRIHDNLNELKKQIEYTQKDYDTYWSNGFRYSQAGNDIMKLFEETLSTFEKDFNILTPKKFKMIYIPILRGLRPIGYINEQFTYDDIYSIRTKEDHFDANNSEFEIFTGLTVYNQIRSLLLGDLNQRKLMKEFEEYISDKFFDNKPIALIPSEKNNILTIKIGKEKEQPIYELGDGIQSLIIIAMPIFLHRDSNLLIFIEEPEQLMHPGIQRKLINTFLNKNNENCQYFVTTHSNHFLDITLDFSEMSIYILRKKLNNNVEEEIPSFSIENISHGDPSSLELLGVMNSSVFLSNCTIWVEGITDRWYFRHYLNMYKEYLKNNSKDFIDFNEDINYSFVEYGGVNITHWSFLDKEEKPINVERLCGRLFLIVDRDEDKEKRFEDLEKVLGERFYPLKCREVENLLNDKVLFKVIAEYEGRDPEISFNESDYKNEKLGKFIDEKLGSERKRKSYQTESGSIKDKTGFCKKALDNIKEYNDLSDEAKEICKKIYQFIKVNNT